MWTRHTLMRALPDCLVVLEEGQAPCLGCIWEVTETTATVRVLTGTRLREATMPIRDVVRQLNKAGMLTITHWQEV